MWVRSSDVGYGSNVLESKWFVHIVGDLQEVRGRGWVSGGFLRTMMGRLSLRSGER